MLMTPSNIISGVSSNGPPVVSPSSVPSAPTPPPQMQEVVLKPNPACPFLCEWSGCMKAFKTPKEVENHAIKAHCPIEMDDIPCLWSRCDGMKRKRFSLMTHIQDRHCHPQLMKLMAVRRVQLAQNGKSDVPLPPAPPPHPGYAPNAAYHAIKRHALEFVSPKEMAMRDEKEGPVTKSIRLTSSLILKNLVIYSALGKSKLRAYESHLSTVALSNVESSRTMSQILYDMSEKDQKT
ncbi:ARID2 [Lepeophtheirus salmonis]|uniref:ARID2 n=1 Tax=Lepeophtheirus salmonis TaxID=72036 RepID=A0A7R8H9M9_LEPSM|nr:ARID2 [Lepeophtheirus salmonis]CAF2952313.1 ARID2 [Lepeophtheirus salmonis]